MLGFLGATTLISSSWPLNIVELSNNRAFGEWIARLAASLGVYYVLFTKFHRRRFPRPSHFGLSSKGWGRRLFSTSGAVLAQGAVTLRRRKFATNKSVIVIQPHTEGEGAELLPNHPRHFTPPQHHQQRKDMQSPKESPRPCNL
jgi:hypothetical protein